MVFDLRETKKKSLGKKTDIINTWPVVLERIIPFLSTEKCAGNFEIDSNAQTEMILISLGIKATFSDYLVLMSDDFSENLEEAWRRISTKTEACRKIGDGA